MEASVEQTMTDTEHGPIHGMMEKLSEKCTQPPIMEFEGFILRPFDGWHLWLEHPSGEGTTIRKDMVLGWLVRMFKENF